MSPFILTNHAVDRYMERVEQCSKRDARDRLTHALSISRPATKAEVRTLPGRARQARHNTFAASRIYRFCDVENLLIVCRPEGMQWIVLTVIRVNVAEAVA